MNYELWMGGLFCCELPLVFNYFHRFYTVPGLQA